MIKICHAPSANSNIIVGVCIQFTPSVIYNNPCKYFIVIEKSVLLNGTQVIQTNRKVKVHAKRPYDIPRQFTANF